ncbi:MAG: type II toxin-antitoxin system VapC family toxin [bacterium]
MKCVYIDTSVVNINLFGTKKEPERYSIVMNFFNRLNSQEFEGLISLYTLQEIYAFCEDNFPLNYVRKVVKLSFQELLKSELQIIPLLKRSERLVHQRKFPISDLSDQPHAILAYLNGCDAIITYDDHFRDIGSIIKVFTPEEFLDILDNKLLQEI